MRVKNEKGFKKADKAGKRGKATGKESVERKSFPDVLNRLQAQERGRNLDEVIAKLEEIGQRLAKTFSFYDLKEYKETLTLFLGETEKETYRIQEETYWSKWGKPKLYQTIHLINKEVEELSSLVLAKQKDTFKVLKQLDYIKGLLIDLYS